MNRRRPPARSVYDAEIWRLALPAFGALAAEPLYVLVDTAIIGQLGTHPLGGLAIAGTVLTVAFAVGNFLAYSTTATVARLIGAGHTRDAVALGRDAMFLGAAIGLVLAIFGVALAPVIVDAMGASDAIRTPAVTYLRISALGAPAVFVMFAATGYLRGRHDTRTTLVIAVASNALNLALELLLVFGFDWGIASSAWGTVVAQIVAATVFIRIVRRRLRAEAMSTQPRLSGMRTTAVLGGPLMVRTITLLAVFLIMTNLAARIGDVEVAAHQIAFQLYVFLALCLDALAIAGQAMVGRFLGASRADDARAAARRMIEWGCGLGLLFAIFLGAVRTWLVPLFTDSPNVADIASELLLVLAILQPLGALVFVLDGVLIGAGDQRYLAVAMTVATVGVFVPTTVLVMANGGGIVALWIALGVWMAARAAGLAARYAGGRWQVTGAHRT